MKRLVLVLALALVLVGSAAAEPLASYGYTYSFGESESGGFEVPQPSSRFFISSVQYDPTTSFDINSYVSSTTYSFSTGHDDEKIDVTFDIGGVWYQGARLTEYTQDNPYTVTVNGPYQYILFNINMVSVSEYGDSYAARAIALKSDVVSYLQTLSSSYPSGIGVFANALEINGRISIYVYPLESVSVPDFLVDMRVDVQEPWFDLFGMRGLSTTFTPSNPDEDYYVLFAGSDSWVGENPDKWVWTRVHGSTFKSNIIFSGNRYTWFVKYKDEIKSYSFAYTGEEGSVPPLVVPDPEPERPDTPPIIDSPGDVDPDYPSMPDIDSPDLTVDFTSGFDDYENMTIYRDVRNMIDGFTSSIAPNIETMQFYESLQQVIAYLQLVMEQLQQKYAVPIYNILASVSSFVPTICWLAVDIAIIFGMFRFVVHIITGPISSAIRERF